MSSFFDLSGAFYAQKNYVKDLQNRPVTDTTVSGSLLVLQNNLDSLYGNFVTSSGTSSAVLDHQTKMNEVVTTELDRLQKKKTSVDLAIEGQRRAVQLNESYRKKYSYYVKIVVLIIIFLLVFIGLNLLSQYLPMIPSYVFDILYFFLAVTLLLVVYSIYLDIIWRDNMNFDELAFSPPNITDPNAVDLQQQNASKMGDLLGTINVIGCVGNNCCDPETAVWDSGNSICKGISHFSSMGDISVSIPNSPYEFENYSLYTK